MHSFSKKGEISTTFIVTLSVGLVFLLVAVLFVVQIGDYLNQDFLSQTSCWATNTVRCGGGVFASVVPNLCAFDTIEEPLDEEGLAYYMRDSWWMYKEGQCDFGTAADDVYPVYAFSPEEDLYIPDFFARILSFSRNVKVDDVENSDYNYFEANTEGQTLCFDMESPDIENLYLEKDETYFILYYDDQELIGQSYGDRLLVSTDSEFDKEWTENMLTAGAVGAAVTAGLIIVTVASGGTATAIYIGGVAGAADLVAATVLFVGAVSAKTALIAGTATAAAGAGAGFYVSSDLESDGGCLAYGPTSA